MASKGGPKREGILGAIALAIFSSKLKGIADRATLKSVISGQYRDLVKEETLDLQVLWNLLKDLPGFSKTDAKSAFCLLKTWESDFHLEVIMPTELEGLSSSETDSAAAHCMVSASKKAQAFDPETKAVQATPSSSGGSRNKRSTMAKAPAKEEGASKGLIGLLVVVLLAGGGFTLYKTLQSDGNKVAIDKIAADLPIQSATRKGAELSLKLNGEEWFFKDDPVRKQGMENTLKSVAPLEIDTVMVYDGVGNFRASAKWFGDPPSIAVRLKD